jgi:hypothetical protein
VKCTPALLPVLLFLGATLVSARQQPPPPPQTPSAFSNGLETSWDVRNITAALAKDSDNWRPILARLRPQQWYEQKGAPSTYILQLQTLQRQLNDVTVVTRQLTAKTDSLSLCLDDYFRLEAFDVTARTLLDGVEKYGDRQTSDQMSALLARNFNNRERFRDYILDLALSMEQNFKIADEEAQRCRGIISKEGAPSSRKHRN